MTKKVPQGSAPFASKLIIIALCILYVSGPLHEQVGKVLHTLVHTVEMPDSVLQHYADIEEKNIHKSTHHARAVSSHEHGIIEIVENILEKLKSGKDVPEQQKTSTKIDKHIKWQTTGLEKKEIFDYTKPILWQRLMCKIHRGYTNGLKKPPRFIRYHREKQAVPSSYS